LLYLKIKVSTETRPFFPLLQDASVQNVSRRPFVGDTYGNKGLCPGQFLAYVVYCWIPTMHSRALSLWFIGINHRIHILPDTTASPRSDEKRTGGNLNVSEEKHCQCSANWQADASQASAAPVFFFFLVDEEILQRNLSMQKRKQRQRRWSTQGPCACARPRRTALSLWRGETESRPEPSPPGRPGKSGGGCQCQWQCRCRCLCLCGGGAQAQRVMKLASEFQKGEEQQKATLPVVCFLLVL
jgi:hypothetical protein